MSDLVSGQQQLMQHCCTIQLTLVLRRSVPHTACHDCRLSSAAYAAIACLAIEFVGLFWGVSMFLRAHNCVYILLHFAGAIVTGLVYTQVGTSSWKGTSWVCIGHLCHSCHQPDLFAAGREVHASGIHCQCSSQCSTVDLTQQLVADSVCVCFGCRSGQLAPSLGL